MRHRHATLALAILLLFLASIPGAALAQSASLTDRPQDVDGPSIQTADAQQPADPSQQTADTAADQPSQPPVESHVVHNFLTDEYHMWTGPFHAHNYDSHTMKKYGLPFVLISAALIATDTQTARLLPNSTSQVNVASTVSAVGAPYTWAGISGITYLIGRETGNDHARETGFLALEAVAHSQLIVYVIKELTQRQRPLAGTRRGGFWEGGDSFPSGHAIGAFAVAGVFAYEYRDHIAVPIVAYSAATAVDLSRLGAQKHWLSDLFVGSSMGFLIGRYVYRQHHDDDLPGNVVPRTSWLIPEIGDGDKGFGLYWKF